MDQGWMSRETRPRQTAIAAHQQHVITCLQFDDDKVITGSDDTLIHVHDMKSGELRNELQGHESGIWCLQYEGNVLVSGSADRTIRVWDISSGRCQHVLQGHIATVRCLQILMPVKTMIKTDARDSDDAAMVREPLRPLIISGSRDGELRVWLLPPITDGHQENPEFHESNDNPYFMRALFGHSQTVRYIAAAEDTLVSGSDDSTLRVWRVSTGELYHVLTGHSQRVSAVILDDERSRVISASLDSQIKVWDLNNGSCMFTLRGHELPIRFLALHGEHLASADDTKISTWSLETGNHLKRLAVEAGHISGLQLDATKTIWGGNTSVMMQDTRTGECTCLLSDLNEIWQVKCDARRCVAAVQRSEVTYIEVCNFPSL